MLYIPLTVMMVMCGLVLFAVTWIIPFMRLMFMDWIALICCIVPSFIWVYVVQKNRLIWNLEKLPPKKLLIWFLRRDGHIVPVLGERAYPGESFIDVPKLGLIHDLGKDSVYRIGVNDVRFALENVNHTPDPRYANFTSRLQSWGFNNYDEVKIALLSDELGVQEFRDEIAGNIDKGEDSVEVLANEILDNTALHEPIKKVAKVEEARDWIDRLKPRVMK